MSSSNTDEILEIVITVVQVVVVGTAILSVLDNKPVDKK